MNIVYYAMQDHVPVYCVYIHCIHVLWKNFQIQKLCGHKVLELDITDVCMCMYTNFVYNVYLLRSQL